MTRQNALFLVLIVLLSSVVIGCDQMTVGDNSAPIPEVRPRIVAEFSTIQSHGFVALRRGAMAEQCVGRLTIWNLSDRDVVLDELYWSMPTPIGATLFIHLEDNYSQSNADGEYTVALEPWGQLLFPNGGVSYEVKVFGTNVPAEEKLQTKLTGVRIRYKEGKEYKGLVQSLCVESDDLWTFNCPTVGSDFSNTDIYVPDLRSEENVIGQLDFQNTNHAPIQIHSLDFEIYSGLDQMDVKFVNAYTGEVALGPLTIVFDHGSEKHLTIPVELTLSGVVNMFYDSRKIVWLVIADTRRSSRAVQLSLTGLRYTYQQKDFFLNWYAEGRWHVYVNEQPMTGVSATLASNSPIDDSFGYGEKFRFNIINGGGVDLPVAAVNLTMTCTDHANTDWFEGMVVHVFNTADLNTALGQGYIYHGRVRLAFHVTIPAGTVMSFAIKTRTNDAAQGDSIRFDLEGFFIKTSWWADGMFIPTPITGYTLVK